MMALMLGDHGARRMHRDMVQPERDARIDHRHHAAAQRGETMDLPVGARHRHDRADIDHRFDLCGVDRDGTAGDLGDEKELRHQRPPADWASAASRPGRS